jgi:hypothetical protein
LGLFFFSLSWCWIMDIELAVSLGQMVLACNVSFSFICVWIPLANTCWRVLHLHSGEILIYRFHFSYSFSSFDISNTSFINWIGKYSYLFIYISEWNCTELMSIHFQTYRVIFQWNPLGPEMAFLNFLNLWIKFPKELQGCSYYLLHTGFVRAVCIL